MTRDTDPGASARRIAIRAAFLVVPLVLGALGLPWVMRQLRPGAAAVSPPPPAGFKPATDDELAAAKQAEAKLADAEDGWRKVSTIAPGDAHPDAGGEAVRWFQGFGVQVESTPPGATVLVNGVEAGETPLVASVACKPGEPVQVEVRRAGFAAYHRATTCRADALVELTARLRAR